MAYLNGVKIAERNAPAAPSFDSVATATHRLGRRYFRRRSTSPPHLEDLVAGQNILAIHGLNRVRRAAIF